MNKTKQHNFPNETPLDDYEKELKAFLDRGKFVSLPKKEFEKEKKLLRETAKQYLELKKSRSITLRIKNENLIKVKARAEKHNIPYQRLINILIDQYANEKIRVVI